MENFKKTKTTVFKKFISTFLAVLMMLSVIPLASFAINDGDTIKVTGANNWTPGFYYDFSGHKELGFGGKRGQHQRIRANGSVAYCVEPDKHLTDGNKTARETFYGLTDTQQQLIKYAFIYGYSGTIRYGSANADIEEVATQAIIWAIVRDIFYADSAKVETFLNCAFGGSTSGNNRNACKSVYHKIEEQIKSHRTLPSFAVSKESDLVLKQPVTLNYNSATQQYEGRVPDTNGVLSGYTFSRSGVTFVRDGNDLCIFTKNEFNGSEAIAGERTSNTYSGSLPKLSTMYCVSSSQVPVMSVTSRGDPVNAYFSLKTEGKGKIQIKKHAEKGDAIGTMFNIKGNGVDMNVTINTLFSSYNLCDGYVLAEDLKPGTYTITEIGIHEKYYVTPSTSQTVTVRPNETATVSFDNSIRRGNLEVHKNAEDGNNAGYKFTVSGTAICGDNIYQVITTDANGKASLTNIPIGTYTVKEINCPSYMVQPSSQSIEVKFNSTASVTFENKFKRADVIFSKVDNETGDAILANDAVFEIYEYNKNSDSYDTLYGTLNYSASLDSSKYGTSVGYYATKLPITSTNEGKYRVVEVKAPTGYVIDKSTYDVVLTDDNSVVKVNDGLIVNKIQKAQIELTKTDRETGKAVKDAVYGVYAKSDIIANGVLIVSANTKVDTLMTDENGKATSVNLYLGEYYVKEENAPYGYALDDTHYDVTLSYDAEKAEVFTQTSRVSDLPQKATVEVIKKDAETERLIIAPAKYGVYARDDIFVNGDLKYSKDELVSNITTENGRGKSIPLYLGTYYVKELEAPNGYNGNTNTYYVPLMYQGQNVTVFNFDVTDKDFSQKGKIKITKTDAETNETINSLVSEFEVYARNKIIVNGETIYNAGKLVTTVKTIGGVAETDYLPLGDYFVKEKTAPTGYVINNKEYDVSLVYDNSVESVSAETTISDMPQKAKITVSKVDRETLIPVANAVYVIKAKADIKVNGDLKYRAGQIVAEVTTNANGQAVTEPLYLGSYTVTEKFAPKPYVKDKTPYSLDIVYAGQDVDIQPVRYNASNIAQKATIKLTKFDKETNMPLANAVFNVIAAEEISVNGSVKHNANDIVCEITTNEDGIAISPELYLGKYKLVEKTAPNGYVINNDEIPANLEYQGQEVEVFEEGYTAENAPQKAIIEITKTDKETNNVLSGAEYEIYAAEDISLNGDLKYSKDQLVDTVVTNEEGKAESKQLYLGKYYVVEKTAPYGYVLNTERKEITLNYKGQNVLTFTENMEFSNIAQKGTITISKYGEVLNNVDENDGVYTPEYAVKPLQNAVYDIIANEDIYTADGTKRASEGEIVDTVATGEDGKATSKELYLGNYKIVEKTAPYGMVNNAEPQYVTLAYAGQNETLTSGSTSFVNERQKATVEVEKLLEKDDLYNIGNADEITNVKFGLFADEDIVADNGTKIAKDGLIETANADENGHIEFSSDIPLGKYYVKEVSTDKHYVPSDAKYPVEFTYAGQSVLAVRITANDGNAINNDIIRGTVIGRKIDDDGNAVKNATMGLFSTETTEFTKETAYAVSVTDENGEFTFTEIPYGNYVVREIEAPEGFVLSETSTPVTITENAQVVEIEVLNSIITGNLSIVKVDKDFKDKKLNGAVFDIYLDVNANGEYDEDIDTLYGTMTNNENGDYLFEGLRYNGYFVHERTAPEGFLADDEYYYFEIRNNEETVVVSNNDDNETFENAPIIGIIEITKTDVATGDLIPNAGFRICDMEGNTVAEGYTDENGVATFTLRYGKYTYQEFDAAPGYLLDETKYEFEIKENGEIVKANMTNEMIPVVEIPKTGDSARGVIEGIAGLSALSVLGIYLSRKKKDEDEECDN